MSWDKGPTADRGLPVDQCLGNMKRYRPKPMALWRFDGPIED